MVYVTNLLEMWENGHIHQRCMAWQADREAYQAKKAAECNAANTVADKLEVYSGAMLAEAIADNGIKLEFTVPHTPEQNGVAERTNCKILDKGRTIMRDAGAPDFLWADAFAW